TSVPSDLGAPPYTGHPSPKGNTRQARTSIRFFQWPVALFLRMGAGSRRRPCRRPGKLATSAQQTGTSPQRTARKLLPDWRSRALQYGSRWQSRRVGSVGAGHGRESDRERPFDWSLVARDPRPGGGADGRARPRHRRFTETTFDTVRRLTEYNYAAHSGAAPARSNVRSAAERSALSKTRRGWCVEVGGKCEVKSLPYF